MDPLDRIRVFLRVAELASFTQAARALGLPKGSVSTAVSQLEGELGARLLHRTTRRVQLTQDGLVFSERARDLVSDLEELTGHFRTGASDLKGRIRVDMSTSFAQNVILPRLPDFLAEHPGIEVELSSTERMVDLAQEGFDFTVRTSSKIDPTLIARPLGAFRVMSVVSRSYAAKFGVPQTLEDLEHHRIVHYATVFGTPPDGFEYVDGESGEVCTVPMRGAVTVSSAGAYVAAARAGLGLVQVPEVGVRESVLCGELIEVLAAYPCPSLPVYLVYLNRRHQPRRVRVFMDWIGALVSAHLTS